MSDTGRLQNSLGGILRNFFAFSLISILAACGVDTATPTAAAAAGFDLQTWGISLSRVNISEITQSDTDLVVVEPNGLSVSAVKRLGRQPDGTKRVVLAYLNIGEVESYRSYWHATWNRNPPEWVGRSNPNWSDHFFVHYWAPEWQAILMGSNGSALDQIIAAGFDGVVLDGVDKYQVWPSRQRQARADMLTLVDRIAQYSRARNPRFLIVPNNAEDLLSDTRYLGVIDAIVKESLLFGVQGVGQRNPRQMVNASLNQLTRAQRAGRPVLVVEYLSQGPMQSEAATQLNDLGMLVTFGRRDLSRLTRAVTRGESGANRLKRLESVP